MIYQLADGTIINISLEEFLSLGDEDIQLYIHTISNGESPNSPWMSSAVVRHRNPGNIEFSNNNEGEVDENEPPSSYNEDSYFDEDFLNEDDI